MKIIGQELKWLQETNECLLITKYANGALVVEGIDSEEAAKWQAERKF